MWFLSAYKSNNVLFFYPAILLLPIDENLTRMLQRNSHIRQGVQPAHVYCPALLKISKASMESNVSFLVVRQIPSPVILSLGSIQLKWIFSDKPINSELAQRLTIYLSPQLSGPCGYEIGCNLQWKNHVSSMLGLRQHLSASADRGETEGSLAIPREVILSCLCGLVHAKMSLDNFINSRLYWILNAVRARRGKYLPLGLPLFFNKQGNLPWGFVLLSYGL